MSYGMAIKVHYNPDLERRLYHRARANGPDEVSVMQAIAAPKFHKTTGGQTVNGTLATPEKADVTCKVCLAKMAKMDQAVYLAATS